MELVVVQLNVSRKIRAAAFVDRQFFLKYVHFAVFVRQLLLHLVQGLVFLRQRAGQAFKLVSERLRVALIGALVLARLFSCDS